MENPVVQVPRIVIAGVTSGVGKTTVALATMHAFRNKGLRVQPFKVGPDFIDPSYHSLITGRQSRNLDVWMMGRRGVGECFVNACIGADVAVIEGVMGLFDGMSGRNNFASTAHVARILKAPVILVVDAAKAARSVAAIVLGFLRFDRSIRIAGIILNNVAGDRHARYILEALETKANIPVVGIIRRNSAAKLQERHLGLVPALELNDKKRKAIVDAARLVYEQIDSDKLLKICGTEPLPDAAASSQKRSSGRIRLAVALDDSFNFYYSDNLDALRNCGARLEYFSPVHDGQLPHDIQGIIIGGGFPEVLADKLEKNSKMLKAIRNAVEDGMPVYAECGGLMYLTRSIRGYKGEPKAWKMAGLVDADTIMTGKLTLNYTEASCNSVLLGRTKVRGHEFHYSQITNISNDSRFAYTLRKGQGVDNAKDGFVVGENGLAAYMHLHFAGNKIAEKLFQACARYSNR